MKNFKKIASAIAALSLAACVAVPMSATVFTASADPGDATTSMVDPTSETCTLTIKDTTPGMKYEAYQIFSGSLEKTVTEGESSPAGDTTTYGVLTNVVWGSGVDETTNIGGKILLEAIKAISVGDTQPFKDCATPAKVAEILGGATTKEDPEIAKAFAKAVAPYLKADEKATLEEQKTTGSDVQTTTGYKATKLKPGYYLVQNEAGSLVESGKGKDEAYTRYILAVTGETEAAPKKAKPTVDKQVLDEAADKESTSTDGWGETADHDINETFKFKLIAKMPEETTELDEYEKYKLVFHDSWSEGVTYDGNIVLSINGTPITLTSTDSFASTSSDSAKGVTWTVNKEAGTLEIKIDDLKALLSNVTGVDKLSDVENVTVTYDAHLNDKAIVSNGGFETKDYKTGATVNVNLNDVYLEYSNNPNNSGEGSSETGNTPKDTVGVFTYEVDNSKVDGANENTTLAGAEFEVYKVDPFADGNDSEQPIELFAVKGGESGTNILGYRLKTDKDTSAGDEKVTTIISGSDGNFKLYGLDAGTYYLKEVKAPSSYNLLTEAVTIVISADHSELSDTAVKLDLTNSKYANETISSTLSGKIKNNKGATLPSTGAIGTTLFYLGGGALVAVAGVMLITKKRMTKE